MNAPLWTGVELAGATGGTASADFCVEGVAFDSREIGPGDLFVALPGASRDGHDFVDTAFDRGAAGAIVDRRIERPVARPCVVVADTVTALDALGTAARARSTAVIIGVTGSVGKTGTKEAIAAALDRSVPGRVHRSLKSYNNHVGVPLSLARMPRSAEFGVFEMGMNHAGELRRLTALVRPDVALVTAIAPAHTAFFADEGAIADAKGEIFCGLNGGAAIIPHDSVHCAALAAAARPHAERIVTFGRGDGADVRAVDTMRTAAGGTFITARLRDAELSFTITHPGEHWVMNALAVLATVDAVGGDLVLAGLALADLPPLDGRGARLPLAFGDGEIVVIDESYNANPASMIAALAVFAVQEAPRRIAVLGEMRELGAAGPDYHAALATPLSDARVDLAILVGPAMAPLANALEGHIEFVHVSDAAAALGALKTVLAPGDAVLVKGSNGVGLATLVTALGGGPRTTNLPGGTA